MSESCSQLTHRVSDEDGEFALSSQQLLAARDPGTPISTVIGERDRFASPELARLVNERLAAAVAK